MTFDQKLTELAPDTSQQTAEDPIFHAVEQVLYAQGISYRLADLFHASYASVSLSELGGKAHAEPLSDLVLDLRPHGFFEIILRDQAGCPRPAGWLTGEEPVRITDEIANSYRVILTSQTGQDLRHEFLPELRGYAPVFGDIPAPLASAQRLARLRAAQSFEATKSKGD